MSIRNLFKYVRTKDENLNKALQSAKDQFDTITRAVNTGTDPAAHILVGPKHTESGLTAGHFLKAASPTTFGFAAHGLGPGDVGAPPTARLISTTLPLAGGGNLSADRTLSIGYDANDLELSGANLRFVFPINVKRYASFAAAVTAIGSTPASLYIPDEQAVAVDVTVPATLTLKRGPSGLLSIGTGVTVTINSEPDIGLNQFFSCTGTGKVVFGAGSIKEVYPQWWGAKGDDSTDCTNAMNAAVTAALSVPSGGAVIYLAAGKYKVTSLDLSNAVPYSANTSIRIVGAGRKSTYIKGTSNGKIIIDAIGRCYLSIEDLSLVTDGTAVYQTGLLYARRVGGEYFCRNNTLKNVDIIGDFSIASMASIAAEQNRFDHVWFENNNPTNNYCCFFTGQNNDISNITSEYGTILASTNTHNLMTHCFFYSGHANTNLIIFDEHANYNFLGCLGIVGDYTGTKFATYIAGEESNFYGPVNWIGTIWEGKSGIVHYLTTAETFGNFQNINDIGGSYTLYGAGETSWAIKSDGKAARVLKCSIRDTCSFLGSGAILIVDADYVIDCYFDIWSPSFETSIIIGSGRYSSFLCAQKLNLPSGELGWIPQMETIGQSDYCGSSLPSWGTWKKGQKYWNTEPTAGGSPGWICTTSGTFSAATDNTGDTDGSTAVITGMTDTSDFAVGEYVSVSAGFPTTGPYRILSLTATTMTLDTNSNSAQSNITVSTPDPVFKAMALLAA